MPGAVLSTGMLACAAAVTLGCAVIGGAAVTGQRVAGAADAAALAAADAVSGAVTGDPCERAREVADVDRATVVDCAVDGFEATVRVTARFGAWRVEAEARAGPPP